jgi:hypothetical protein
MKDMFGNETTYKSNQNNSNTNNQQSNNSVDIFGNPTYVPKKSQPFYTPPQKQELTAAQQFFNKLPKPSQTQEIKQPKRTSPFDVLKSSAGYSTPFETPKSPKRITDSEREKIFGVNDTNRNVQNLTKNPFVNLTLKAIGATTPEKQLKLIKPFESGLGRAAVKIGSPLLFDVPELLMEKASPEYYNKVIKDRKFDEDPFGAASDFGLNVLGWLIPYTGAVKGLKAAGLGAKAIPKLFEGATKTQKFIRGTKVASELAKEGARAEALIAGTQIAARELILPEKYTARENLDYALFNTLLGGVADPAAHGAFQLGKKAWNASKKSPLTEQTKNLLRTEVENGTLTSKKLEDIVSKDTNVNKNNIVQTKDRINKDDYVYPMSEPGNYLLNTPLKIKDVSIIDNQKYYKLEDNNFYPENLISKFDEIPEDIKSQFTKPPSIKKKRKGTGLIPAAQIETSAPQITPTQAKPTAEAPPTTSPPAQIVSQEITPSTQVAQRITTQPKPKDYLFKVNQNIEKMVDRVPVKFKVLEKLFYLDNEGKPVKYYRTKSYSGETKYIKEFDNKIYNDLSFIPTTNQAVPKVTPIPTAQKTKPAKTKPLTTKQISELSDEELDKLIKNVKSEGVDADTEDWKIDLFVEATKRQAQKPSTKKQEIKPSPETKYEKNDLIIHNIFGEGKVISVVPEGNFQKIEVKFEKEKKEFLTQYAPIQKLGTNKTTISEKIDNAITENKKEIRNESAKGNQRLYSSLVPLPTKLQLLYVKQGALYIAKGIVNFSEWSEVMVKNLGESIRPYLKKLYKDSVAQSSKVLSNIESEIKAQIKSERLSSQATGKKRIKKVTQTIEKKGVVSPEITEKTRKEYRQLGNQQTLEMVNKDLQKNGIDASYSDLVSSGEPSAYNTVMAGRLTDEFQRKADSLRRSGDFEAAQKINEKIVILIDDLRDKLNSAGRANQAMALYNRLDENGLILLASKKINSLNKRKGTSSKLNTNEIQEITDIARTMKDSTNNQNLGNRILDIIDESDERQLLPSEVQEIADFVNDSKVFVEQTITGLNQYKSPKYESDITDAVLPKQMNNKEDKKEVLDFINKHAEESKAVLKSAKKTSTMTPLDLYSNYVVIGASKIANGYTKFSDWSEQMIKEVGEDAKPFFKDIFSNSKKALKITSEKITDPEIKKIMGYIARLLNQKKLKVEDYQEARKMAFEMQKLSGDLREKALEDFEIFLNSKFKANVGQRLASFQRINQLLNPKTIARNAIGNELFYRAERLSKYIATPIDIARSKLTGTKREVTFKKYNQESYWKNFLKGARAGWKGTTLDYNLMTQYDLERQSLQDVWVYKYLEKALGAVLYSFDYAAYKRGSGDTISEMATLNAINNNINLNRMSQEQRTKYFQNYFRNVDENVKSLANDYGKYITFQDDNALSVLLQKTKTNLNKYAPIAGKDFGLGNLVINYPRTPGALIVRALEYSPAGILRSAYHFLQYITKNPKLPTSRKATEDLSRALFGTTGLTALGWFALESGILLPNREKDYDVAELQKQTGISGNQVNISALKRFVNSGFNKQSAFPKKGDTLITYDWMQPLSLSIAIGSEANRALREGELKPSETSNFAKTAFNSLLGGLDTVVQQPVLTGVQDLLKIYPGDVSEQLVEKFKDTLSSLPSSLTPTAANQLRQMLDNSVRETYDPNFLTKGLNRAIARIPLASETLPQKFDTLGNLKKSFQESKIENKFGKKAVDAFNVFLNPSFTTKYRPTEEAAYVLDVINRTNDKTVAPRLVITKKIENKKMLGEGNSIVLTGSQYAEYQKKTGDYTREAIARIANLKLNDSQKQRILSNILETSHQKARNDMIRKYKD